jgi:hypothetical protein
MKWMYDTESLGRMAFTLSTSTVHTIQVHLHKERSLGRPIRRYLQSIDVSQFCTKQNKSRNTVRLEVTFHTKMFFTKRAFFFSSECTMQNQLREKLKSAIDSFSALHLRQISISRSLSHVFVLWVQIYCTKVVETAAE